MEFVSSDRTQDAEFVRGLQNYNSQVFESNQEIAAQIDKSKEDLQDTLDDNTEVAGLAQLKVQGAGGGLAAGVLGKATAIPKAVGEAKEARVAGKLAAEKLAARGGFSEVAVSGAEATKLPSGAGVVSKFRPTAGLLSKSELGVDASKTISTAYGGGTAGRKAGIFFKTAQARGIQPTEEILREGPAGDEAKVSARTGSKIGEEAGEEAGEKVADKTVAKAAGEAAEKGIGKVIGKAAVGLARGAGIAGAALSAGSAIEGLVEGKKFKWNEQGAEIGGALLDILGTGLEFTGVGAAAGLALQVGGTALSAVGTVNEGLDIDPTKQAADTSAKSDQAKIQSDLESAQRGATQGLTSAAQGGAAIGRQVQ